MAIEGKNVIKEFGTPPTRVLHDLNFTIDAGDFVSISGRSGSGKSTLLYLISSLDYPSQGSIEIDGRNVQEMKTDEIHRFRNEEVGFIFQFHYLLPELTLLENVLLPARNTQQHHEKLAEAKDYLNMFGIEDKSGRYPSQISGGEQQRAAIARALIMKPRYIFADEPTGNLDSSNAMNVMEILMKVNKEDKTTLVLVTHEQEFSAMANREIYLIDGRIGQRPEA